MESSAGALPCCRRADLSVPRLVIAGTSSGVGKTTVAMGLMAAFRRRGLAVQPFKVGPDYIDPSYHMAATGVRSRNLDSWMVPKATLLELFARACRAADVAVIEGVMGVFDGVNGLDESGSTAQVAKLLGAPVVLVLNVGKMARSAGAMALGYARFDPELRVDGFLLNNVASEAHYRHVQDAIESSGAGRVFGYLPANPHLQLPERYLGLVPTAERALPQGFLDRLVELVEAHIDLDGLLAAASAAGSVAASDAHHQSLFPPEPPLHRAAIGVAEDEAFSFYYQDNLELLQAYGARLVGFSPLRDSELPAELDALYLGGGFPELHAARLAANRSMLESVRRAVDKGMPTYAECGGLMFLCQGIVDANGDRYPMVGAIPGWCSMVDRRLSLGYAEVRCMRDTLLGAAGTQARGHEFHWSRWDGYDSSSSAYQMVNRGGQLEGYARDNILASFVHLHFGANPGLAPAFVQSASSYRQRKQ